MAGGGEELEDVAGRLMCYSRTGVTHEEGESHDSFSAFLTRSSHVKISPILFVVRLTRMLAAQSDRAVARSIAARPPFEIRFHLGANFLVN